MKNTDGVFTNFISRLILGLLCLSLAFIFVRVVTKELLIDRMGIYNTFTHIVLFDKNLEPPAKTAGDSPAATVEDAGFDEDSHAPTTAPASLNALEKFESLVSRVENKILTGIDNNIPYREHIIEKYNCLQLALGWTIPPENKFHLEPGYLSELDPRADVAPYVENIDALKQYLDERNIALLYVQAPPKNPPGASWLGVSDYIHENADDFTAGLDGIGVDYLDLRRFVWENGWDNSSLFYNTDHHWTQKTALWATSEIAGFLNERHGFNLDTQMYELSSYDEEIFPGLFIGSYGRAVTTAYCEPEDFSLLYPKFPTQMSFKIPKISVDLSGPFEVSYNLSHLKTADIYKRLCYSAFAYGDYPLVQFHNELDSSGTRILVIKNSFADPLIQFLSLGTEYLDAIDLRQYESGILKFIDEKRPDAVIFLYGAEALANKSSETYFAFK